jgi:hypothetical protein
MAYVAAEQQRKKMGVCQAQRTRVSLPTSSLTASRYVPWSCYSTLAMTSSYAGLPCVLLLYNGQLASKDSGFDKFCAVSTYDVELVSEPYAMIELFILRSGGTCPYVRCGAAGLVAVAADAETRSAEVAAASGQFLSMTCSMESSSARVHIPSKQSYCAGTCQLAQRHAQLVALA